MTVLYQLLLVPLTIILGVVWLALHIAHLWAVVDVAQQRESAFDALEQRRWAWLAVFGVLFVVPLGGLAALYYLTRVRPRLEAGADAQPLGAEELRRLLDQARQRVVPPPDPTRPIPGANWAPLTPEPAESAESAESAEPSEPSESAEPASGASPAAEPPATGTASGAPDAEASDTAAAADSDGPSDPGAPDNPTGSAPSVDSVEAAQPDVSDGSGLASDPGTAGDPRDAAGTDAPRETTDPVGVEATQTATPAPAELAPPAPVLGTGEGIGSPASTDLDTPDDTIAATSDDDPDGAGAPKVAAVREPVTSPAPAPKRNPWRK